MERRDFMTSVGSLMAFGTLSTPLVGNATTGGLTPGDLSEEGLDAYMDEVSAQIRRIEATVWKMTHQPPNLVVDDCTQKVDRITAAAGFQQDQWEAHYAVVNEDSKAGFEQSRFESMPVDERHPVVVAGLVIMGIGTGVFGAGLVAMGVAGFEAGITATCVWGQIALVGAIVALIGAIISIRKAQQRAG